MTLAPLTPSIFEGSAIQAAIFRFAPGGRLVRHPATVLQILAVLDGSGEVSGADGVGEPIAAGEAVFLHDGEEHGHASALSRAHVVDHRQLRGQSGTLAHATIFSPEATRLDVRFRQADDRFRVRDNIPTGTVTLLVTDVEGSSRLLHELGAGARRASPRVREGRGAKREP